jgi:Cd2+/Zn2+-exporting ATPase
MQVTSLLSRQEHDHEHHHHHHDHDHEHGESCASCGHEHEHATLPLTQTITGLIFVINSFVVTWFLSGGTEIFQRGQGSAFGALTNNPIAAASAMIGAIILGYPIVWTAVKDLRRGLLTTNELVALAVLASFGSGHYQEAGVVAFFMLLGQIIETRTAEGARASIESLIELTPAKARRITAAGEEEVATSQLTVGDVIRVRPGDNVAADGIIVNGQGSFNQANITGESLPVDKKPGDEVFAGTQNLTGAIEIRVTRAGEDTTLGRVRELILAAEKTKLPIMRII